MSNCAVNTAIRDPLSLDSHLETLASEEKVNSTFSYNLDDCFISMRTGEPLDLKLGRHTREDWNPVFKRDLDLEDDSGEDREDRDPEGEDLENSDRDPEPLYEAIEGYPRHDQIDIMTMTAIGHFDGLINDIKNVFYLLPITKINIRMPLRPVKKIKLPYPGVPGIIMTARLGNENRGIYRSETKGTWDNSVMIDISATQKNVNAKLSRTNIQMCGCKSVQMGEEVSQILIEKINDTQVFLDYISENLELARRVSNEVLADGMGDLIKVNDEEGRESFKFGFDPLKIASHDDTTEVDSLRAFFFSQLSDVVLYDDARSKLNWILELKTIIEKPLTFSHVRVGMVKYRFNIGFHIDQQKLFDLFFDIDSEFCGDFYSDIRNYVKIEIPCYTEQKKNGADIRKHTFTVQQTGQTTHSSPILEEMETVYYRFIYVIDQLKDQIILPSPGQQNAT